MFYRTTERSRVGLLRKGIDEYGIERYFFDEDISGGTKKEIAEAMNEYRPPDADERIKAIKEMDTFES